MNHLHSTVAFIGQDDLKCVECNKPVPLRELQGQIAERFSKVQLSAHRLAKILDILEN